MYFHPDQADTEQVTATTAAPYRRNRRSVNRAAQLVHHSSALDPRSGATRAIVWLAFVVGLLWTGVGLSALFSPDTVQPPTWSASVPGQLKLEGKPSVTTSIISADTAEVIVADENESHSYRIDLAEVSSARMFWRGRDLVVDTSAAVWRVDTRHDLLLRAPESYGWPSD
jgi:hypothetical protein